MNKTALFDETISKVNDTRDKAEQTTRRADLTLSKADAVVDDTADTVNQVRSLLDQFHKAKGSVHKASPWLVGGLAMLTAAGAGGLYGLHRAKQNRDLLSTYPVSMSLSEIKTLDYLRQKRALSEQEQRTLAELIKKAQSKTTLNKQAYLEGYMHKHR